MATSKVLPDEGGGTDGPNTVRLFSAKGRQSDKLVLRGVFPGWYTSHDNDATELFVREWLCPAFSSRRLEASFHENRANASKLQVDVLLSAGGSALLASVAGPYSAAQWGLHPAPVTAVVFSVITVLSAVCASCLRKYCGPSLLTVSHCCAVTAAVRARQRLLCELCMCLLPWACPSHPHVSPPLRDSYRVCHVWSSGPRWRRCAPRRLWPLPRRLLSPRWCASASFS